MAQTTISKLARVGAMAYLAASDHRTGRKPSRVPQLLDFICDYIDSHSDLNAAVQPELERLGKQLGFDVTPMVTTVPGNTEKH